MSEELNYSMTAMGKYVNDTKGLLLIEKKLKHAVKGQIGGWCPHWYP